jgi:hypothetical protein
MKRSFSRPLGASIFAASLAIVGVGSAAAPAGQYVIANGTVYDTKTKLTWQQDFSPVTYPQFGAAGYCASLGRNGASWRLPSMKELLTIVDFSVGPPGPTIDSTAFPNTPADYFWSSTPYSGTPGSAWSAQFYYGISYGNDASNTSYVRCVH